MTSQIENDEIQTTRGEKVLALVLTVFLLIGCIWAYSKLEIHHGYRAPSYTSVERTAISTDNAAQQRLYAAQSAVAEVQNRLELSREAYRTALEAHQPSAKLAARYHADSARFDSAQAAERAAAGAVRQTAPAARAAQDRASRAAAARSNHDARNTFLLRLGLLLALIALAFLVFKRLRTSRYLPVAAALLAAVTILAFVMAIDYISDYVSWNDLGPLVLSAVGVTLSLLAFWGLQRYLVRRIPRRRVRRNECPFCGYPVRGTGTHCEGCGRDVVAECAKCAAPRRVGTAHCAACGSS
jgi:hypothetical protein